MRCYGIRWLPTSISSFLHLQLITVFQAPSQAHSCLRTFTHPTLLPGVLPCGTECLFDWLSSFKVGLKYHLPPHKPWIHLITLFNFSVAAFHVLDASYLCICLGVQSLFLLTELYEARDLGLPVHSLPGVIPAHSRSCINTRRRNEREAGTGVWLVSVQSLGS